MRKIIIPLIFGLILSIPNINAQKEVIEYHLDEDAKKIYWGYYLGLNKKDFKINYTQPNTFINVDPGIGFNVGLIGGWNLHKNISLRIEPGLRDTVCQQGLRKVGRT